jgi:feruloyl esterase
LNWDVPAGPEPRPTQWDLWAYVVFQNPKWDYRTLDLDRDVAMADAMDAQRVHTAAIDTNLTPFFSRGGKLLMYHGWADPNIVPINSVNYFEGVTRTLGGASQVANSIRLFMVPGMEHCSGGDGTDTFDMIAVLDPWVERGQAPQRIEASRVRKGAVDRTRPLCPYPQVARYTGTGSTDLSANFVCAAPAR